MGASPNNKKLSTLVKEAMSGSIVLPQFQRDFVWPRKSIESLLDSLLRGHYVGALLFLETDREHMPFGYRNIAGLQGPSTPGGFPDDLVLDGQQRITALHYAFAAPDIPVGNAKYSSRFFLNLDKLEHLEESEDIVWSVRADSDDAVKLSQPETQYETKTLPFTEIVQWEDWKQNYVQWLMSKSEKAVIEHLGGEQARWESAVRRIRDAEVPVVTLDKVGAKDHSKIRQICDVFEKLNSTGLKLTVFDLMTARLQKYGIKLRGSWDDQGLWEQALQNNPLLRQFAGGETNIEEADPENFGVLLLQVVALLRNREVRSKKMIELDAENFEQDWRRAAAATENALKRITNMGADGFGVFDKKWLPSKAMLTVLVALTARLEEGKSSPSAYRALNRWYWSGVFSGRYGRSADTVMYQDFQEMVKFFERQGSLPTTIAEAEHIFQGTGRSLRDISRASGTAYKGVITMVALQGAKDFAHNDGIAFHVLDDHHIFPKNYLNKSIGLSGDKANTIVNRTLIAGSTNRKISNKSPFDYLNKIVPEKYRDEILISHLIDGDARSAMENNDYEAFLAARERALISKIKELVS